MPCFVLLVIFTIQAIIIRFTLMGVMPTCMLAQEVRMALLLVLTRASVQPHRSPTMRVHIGPLSNPGTIMLVVAIITS